MSLEATGWILARLALLIAFKAFLKSCDDRGGGWSSHFLFGLPFLYILIACYQLIALIILSSAGRYYRLSSQSILACPPPISLYPHDLRCFVLSALMLFVCLINVKIALNRKSIMGFFSLHFFKVLCFSACSITFLSTKRPFLFRTLSMYFLATFSRSAFSPRSSNSSSVVGTQ